MKKVTLTMLSAFLMLAAVNTTKAQVSLSVHIGTPPVWAPAAYANNTRYYYIPEIDSYYDAQRGGYYYNDGPDWVFSASLPGFYAGYNIASLHHVPVRYYGDRPYTYFASRRTVYVQRYHPVVYRHVEYRNVETRHYNNDNRGHWDNGRHGGRGPEWHGDNGHGDHGHDDHGHGDHGHGHH
ncbi:hypothetical protein ACFGVR_04525 [Mucilaginibacter sp. AW1-3]